MNIDEIMTRYVQTCRPEDSLQDAAQALWDNDCGCLPVVSSNGATRVVGLVTDRDICMCALFQRKPLADLKVSDAMSKQVFACRSADTVEAAKQMMSGARVRRLPVLDQQDSLVGLVSLADFACKAAQSASQSTKKTLAESEVGDTLAAICRRPANTAPP